MREGSHRGPPAPRAARVQVVASAFSWGCALRIRVQAQGDRAIGRYEIGNRESQDQLCEVHRTATKECVSLVDQIEDRPDDQRDDERAARYAVRNAASTNHHKPSHRGPSYPAQQESFATSLAKLWAASFSPSTVVRQG